MTTTRAAVFLDRDGVVNRASVSAGRPLPPATVEQFELLPGVVAAVHRLRQAGFAVVVVTNQPDVARGRQERAVVEKMHDIVRRQLAPDAVMVCYHDDADRCLCRKPAPGLLLAAAEDLGVDLSRSFMVGDRWRDIEAGRRAGCRTVHVDRGYAERLPDRPNVVVSDLSGAVSWILHNGCQEEASIA